MTIRRADINGTLMAIEIERRFLVLAAFSEFPIVQRLEITQGYFGKIGGFRARIRISVDEKGKHSGMFALKNRRIGICLREYECPLDFDCAKNMLSGLAHDRIVSKTRYPICDHAGLIWSIDFLKCHMKGS